MNARSFVAELRSALAALALASLTAALPAACESSDRVNSAPRLADAALDDAGDAGAAGDGAGADVAPPLSLDSSIAAVDAGPLCDRLRDSAAVCERFDEPSWKGAFQEIGNNCGGIAVIGQDSAKYVSPYHSYRASFSAIDAATQAQCFLSTPIPVAPAYAIRFSIFLDAPVGNWSGVMAVFYGDKRLSVVLDGQNRPGVSVQNGPQSFATGPLPAQTWMTLGMDLSTEGTTMKATLTVDGVTAAQMDYPATPITDPFAAVGLVEVYGNDAPRTIYFDDFAVVAK